MVRTAAAATPKPRIRRRREPPPTLAAIAHLHKTVSYPPRDAWGTQKCTVGENPCTKTGGNRQATTHLGLVSRNEGGKARRAVGAPALEAPKKWPARVD